MFEKFQAFGLATQCVLGIQVRPSVSAEFYIIRSLHAANGSASGAGSVDGGSLAGNESAIVLSNIFSRT